MWLTFLDQILLSQTIASSRKLQVKKNLSDFSISNILLFLTSFFKLKLLSQVGSKLFLLYVFVS